MMSPKSVLHELIVFTKIHVCASKNYFDVSTPVTVVDLSHHNCSASD